MTNQPGFIPSEDRGARLLEQIREQLYISNLIALAQLDQPRAGDAQEWQMAEAAAAEATAIRSRLDRTAP